MNNILPISQFKIWLSTILFSILILANLPAYADLSSSTATPRVQTPGEQFIQNLSKDKSGILLSEDINSSFSFIAPKSVVWYNDMGSSITLSSTLFNNVTILQDQSFSNTFDTPGVYWIHVNGTLGKQMIEVYDPVNDCTIDFGCGHTSDPTICQQFGNPNINGICNDTALENAVKAELQRRDNVSIARQIELQQKMQEKQDAENNLQPLYKQLHALDREKSGDSEFKIQSNTIQNQTEQLEQQITKLSSDINDLEQDNNVRFVCVKDPTDYLTCNTQTKHSSESFTSLEMPKVNYTNIAASQNAPLWTKKIFDWYDHGLLTEDEMFSFVKWLIDNKIMGS